MAKPFTSPSYSALAVLRQLAGSSTLNGLRSSACLGRSPVQRSSMIEATRSRRACSSWRCSASAASRSLRRPNLPANRVQEHLHHRSVSRFFAHKIPTHYNDVPTGYQDGQGLPYRHGELTAQEVKAIFGPAMPPGRAETLLKVLHGRRVAGTLDDPLFAPNTSSYTAQDMHRALDYLRDKVPVDEVQCAGLRAEDELRALEEEEQSNETVEDTAADQAAKKDKDAIAAPNYLFRPVKQPEIRTATSALLEIRARNEAKQKKMEAEAAAKRAELEAQGHIVGGLSNNRRSQSRELSPKMKEYTAAASSGFVEVPVMHPIIRCASVTCVAFAAAVLGIAIIEFFPPELAPEDRPSDPVDENGDTISKPWLTPARVTIAAMVAVNVAVYCVWHLPPYWKFMNRNFLLDVAVPRGWQVINASFSQQNFRHLVMNMGFFILVGLPLCREIGPPAFLSAYIACGALGQLMSFWQIVYSQVNGLAVTINGASAAIFGLMACYFWLHKFEGFKILGLPPDPSQGIPGLAFVALLLGTQLTTVFSRRAQAARLVDSMSHVAGMIVGAGSAEYISWRRRRWMEGVDERMRAEVLGENGVMKRQDVSKEG